MMVACILKIIDPQRHLPHLCRPLLFNLLAGVNGEKVHFSRHGSARVNQLLMKFVSCRIPLSSLVVSPTATPFSSACLWYLATQSRIKVGTAALQATIRHHLARGGDERQNKPVDIVSSLCNASLYDGISVNCVYNAAEAHLGPANDLSECLGIIRRNNLKV